MAGTWVFIEQRDGNIRKVSFEMISKAKTFGDEVSAVVFGKGVEGQAAEYAKYGADKVYVVEGDVFANYNTVHRSNGHDSEYNPMLSVCYF